MSEDDTFGELITLQKNSPRIKLPQRRSNSILPSEMMHIKENERLLKDLTEKERNIEFLEKQVSSFKEFMVSLRSLITDLEYSLGEEILTPDQRNNLDNMPYNEAMVVLRKQFRFLVNEQDNLPKKFEELFSKRALMITDKIESVEKDIKNTRQQRKIMECEILGLDRKIFVSETEKKSLKRIVDSIQETIKGTKSEADEISEQAQNQIRKLRMEIDVTNTKTQEKGKIVETLNRNVDAPMAKTFVDMEKDDEALEKIIVKLQMNIAQEKKDHEMVLKQYEHTRNEINRANETISKLKENVNSATMGYALNVNKDMRQYITDQREEWERKLKSQIKHNKELERQILEIQEEQTMLQPFLVSMEKKLQQEMLKLPSLTDPNHRADNSRRTMPRSFKREHEDAEMKNVKKALMYIKAKRLRAQPPR